MSSLASDGNSTVSRTLTQLMLFLGELDTYIADSIPHREGLSAASNQLMFVFSLQEKSSIVRILIQNARLLSY